MHMHVHMRMHMHHVTMSCNAMSSALSRLDLLPEGQRGENEQQARPDEACPRHEGARQAGDDAAEESREIEDGAGHRL